MGEKYDGVRFCWVPAAKAMYPFIFSFLFSPLFYSDYLSFIMYLLFVLFCFVLFCFVLFCFVFLLYLLGSFVFFFFF